MRLNYPLPLDFSKLMKRGKQKHPKCSLEESIRQHIFLMLVTRFGANRYAYDYGCELWKYDFDSPKTINSQRPNLERSIKELLQRFEPRLGDVSVSIQITAEDLPISKFGTVRKAKKKISIVIKGKMIETNRTFEPKPFIVYLSPIMLDMNS